MIAPRPAAASKPARRVGAKPGFLHHRIGDGADHDGGRDARTRWPAKQERRQHDGAAGAVVSAPHRCKREIDEKLSSPGMGEKRAVDRKQNNERRGHVHRHAENSLERDEEVADETRDIVAAMCPRLRQIGAQHRVGDEQDRNDRHDQSGRAPRRIEKQHDEDHTKDGVELRRQRRAIREILTALDRVDENADRR